MSEQCEIFSLMKAHRQEKRQKNLKSSTFLIERAGIPFISKNNGVHLIIGTKGKEIDFWPSTGLYIKPGESRRFRGVKNLIKDYRRNN